MRINAALQILLGVVCLADDAPPQVTVLNGTYEGIHDPIFDQDQFLGMRYSKPPVGDLRFRPAQATDTKFNGTLDAKEYTPFCVGYGTDTDGHPQTEDCLAINVVKPANIPEGTLLPVALWIHGGGLTNGASSRPNYNLSNIVRVSQDYETPIIGASINYRVAGWGFLASKEILEQRVGNLGLRDQRLALQWVQDNIAAFGGDPAQVTIWGESAGGLSVGAHAVGFGGNSAGLFRGIIAESGGPYWYSSYKDLDIYQPAFDNLTAMVNCSAAHDKVACLRTVPFDALDAALRAQQRIWSFPLIDGIVFDKYASISLHAGQFAKVPLLIGSNSDEGTAFGPTGLNTSEQFREYVKFSTYPKKYMWLRKHLSYTTDVSADGIGPLPDSLVDGILELYPDDPAHDIPLPYVVPSPAPASIGAQYKRADTYAGDKLMIATRRASCETWAANGIPAFCYQFDTKPENVPPMVGVTHFTEVAWVFNNTIGRGYDPSPFQDAPPRYFELALEMSRRWIAFTVDGNPNVEGYPEWPDYATGAEQIRFAGNVSKSIVEKDDYRKEGMRFINDHALEYHR